MSYPLTTFCCAANREGRVLGVLEVSRSIGDGRFKGCGVTCVPDVMRCTLTENDRYRAERKCTNHSRFSHDSTAAMLAGKTDLSGVESWPYANVAFVSINLNLCPLSTLG